MTHCRSNLPVQWPDVWSFQRDCAKGTTPLADWYLREARRDMPPSKAHKRRILGKRDRPTVTRPPPPVPVDMEPRQRFNSAAQLGREVAQIARNAALVERHLIRSNDPVRVPSTNMTPPTPSVTVPPVERMPTIAELDARIVSLAADYANERVRLDALRG